MIIYSILQALGVVSILPFIYVLTNPDVIYENSILIFIKDFLSINDDQTFLIILALFSFFCTFIRIYLLYTLCILLKFFIPLWSKIIHTLFDTYLKQNYVFFLKYDSTQLLKIQQKKLIDILVGLFYRLLKFLINLSF